MNAAMPRLPPAAVLEWRDSAPRAVSYDDVYCSAGGGLRQAEAVFLAGARLPDAWAGRALYTIGELGFGAGLNALTTWRAWRRTREPGARLHFVSIEGFPMSRAEAARTLAAYPEIDDLASALLAAWPHRARGAQRLWFEADGFALTIVQEDVERALSELTGAFDAWFLDGFSPAKNPAMWRRNLFHRIAALSAPGARAASYSVAGEVRAGLEEAGFTVARAPGFDGKKQRLEARLSTPPQKARSSALPFAAAAHRKRALIVGAGVAGACAAAAFRRRGVETVLLDPAAKSAASRNRAALLTPRLDGADSAIARLFIAAYLEALRFYPALDAFEPLTIVEPVREGASALLADPPLTEDLLAPFGDGLAHKAGLVRPTQAIERLTAGCEILVETAAALESAPRGWRVRNAAGQILAEADIVVLACGPRLAGFAQTRWLPLRLTRGQVEWAPLSGTAPERAVAAKSYAAPLDGGLMFGATFDRLDAAPAEIQAEEHARRRNLAALERLDPAVAARIDRARIESRAGLRAAAPDYAPIAGLAPDAAAWRDFDPGLAHGRAPAGPGPAHPGLYLLGGFSARGFMLAPLLAERIAAEALGEPQAMTQPMLDAANPARFLVRALKRGQKIEV